MKTLTKAAKSQPHWQIPQSMHWLAELLFGVVGAMVLALVVMLSVSDAFANDGDSVSHIATRAFCGWISIALNYFPSTVNIKLIDFQ